MPYGSTLVAGGYGVGPILPSDVPPWPVDWEQDPRIDDGHLHEWETVLLAPGPERQRLDEVVRCAVCLAPRCGHVHDLDPCMERRHHQACHRHLSGARTHVSGHVAGCRCSR